MTQMPTIYMMKIHAVLNQIKESFSFLFDQSWFAAVVDKLPVKQRDIRDIRYAFSLSMLSVNDLPLLRRGIKALKSYIETVQTHMLPQARELLGLSSFSSDPLMTDDSRILKSLALYALPYNLEQLKLHIADLESLLSTAKL